MEIVEQNLGRHETDATNSGTFETNGTNETGNR